MEIVHPKRIVEIGSAGGLNSRAVAGWCMENGGFLDVIETSPRFDCQAFENEFFGHAAIHVGSSLTVLPTLQRPDLVLIDGDHNWYTVFHELEAVERLCSGAAYPICIFHDTGWPYGRRDMYYDPGAIPEEYRQPWYRGPIWPGVPGTVDYGLNPQFVQAPSEGGARNGVLTAIEDFVAGSGRTFQMLHMPILFGLTVLIENSVREQFEDLTRFLESMNPGEPWRSLLAVAEDERCAGIGAIHRLMPLGAPPSEPYAAPVGERSFSPQLPAEVLARIQAGTLRYTYRGKRLLKNPFDMAIYLQLLGRLRPKVVLEIGSFEGGSALWFADMMAAQQIEGQVISVDCQPPLGIEHPRITFFEADALQLHTALRRDLLDELPHPWLVVEDSAYRIETCQAVLEFFDDYLRPGDYIVVEGGIVRGMLGEHYRTYQDGPSRALEGFLSRRGRDYEIDVECCDFYGLNVTYNPNGWLRRRDPITGS